MQVADPPIGSRILKRVRRAHDTARNRWATVNQAPIFVLGHPKSGTTAVAELLGRRTGLSVTRGVPALFGSAVGEIRSGERSFAEVVQSNRLAFSRDIVKLATMVLAYDQLRISFPGARYVMVVRDPRDNVRSILDRLGLSGRAAELGPQQVAALPEAWRSALDASTLGLPDGTYIQVLARRWRLATEAYLADRRGMDLIRYEDFVEDRAGAIDRLAEQLGVRPTRDISSWALRQFQPAGRNRDTSWLEFFGSENLTEIERICGSGMSQLGYPLDAHA